MRSRVAQNLDPYDVAAAVRELYRVFDRTRQGNRVWFDDGFPRDKWDLPERKTVSELAPEDYEHLAWHGLCFDGDWPGTIKYFLPRLMKDLVGGTYRGIAPEMVISYLARAGWRTWSKEEVRAVEWFLSAWFWSCTREPSGQVGVYPLTERLKLLAFAGMNIIPIVRQLMEGKPAVAVAFLSALLDEFWFGLRNGGLPSWRHVWHPHGVPDEVVEQIRREILSPKAESVLEAAFFAAEEADVQWEISRQLQTMESLRTVRGRAT
jgi:hypothetical protein